MAKLAGDEHLVLKTMKNNLPFDSHVLDYEKWFSDYPFVFKSEVEALRQMMPQGDKLTGIEVALGTGRFSEALGIKEGIEPSPNMRQLAVRRGIDVVDGQAEHLPYADLRFDFVLMAFCISYFSDLHLALVEANRVLKKGGVLVLGFVEKNSIIGKAYEERRPNSTFYKSATFFTVKKVIAELERARFSNLQFCQTLFHALDEINQLEPATTGFGEGSFVVIQAKKS